MKPILLLSALLLFICNSLFSQQPWNGKDVQLKITVPTSQLARTVTADVCGNGLDDDGNGLRDCEDYSCYFNTISGCNCIPIDVVWLATNTGKLYWVNHQSGIEQYVGQMARQMTDITWAPNGKLYGVDFNDNKIWEINPLTAQLTYVTTIAGYNASNAMTSDADGNLYLASRSAVSWTDWHIIKVNPASGQISFVADLTPSNCLSAGDLAYKNGILYLACTGDRLATINISTGQVIASPIIGLLPGSHIYGIVVKADGTLFLGDNNKLYSLDLSSMQVGLYYTCTSAGMNIWGMANFNDYCLAPGCAARVEIDIASGLPYCARSGVQLNAIGSGIAGSGDYRWTLPDGSTATTSSITAMLPGKYKVRYSRPSDNCGWEDSVDITFTAEPAASLGEDTSLCTGSSFLLQPTNTNGVTSYLWQDGSTDPSFMANGPGLYWVETSNACGVKKDSIKIDPLSKPKVELGGNKFICEFDIIELKNLLDSKEYDYRWVDNSTGKSMVVKTPGIYWADVTNSCGTVRDSVLVVDKPDDCECSVYMPTGFTPNHDGKNDLIKLNSNCPVGGELFIYNRNGELVFHTRDLQKGWDGVYRGMPQQTGVYVFQANYRYGSRPAVIFKKGSFVLIR
jgi:gliding motility-associated-like protein